MIHNKPLKAKKNVLPFNKCLDVKLLKLVEGHRVLYDPSDPKHMDLDSRESAWKQIGDSMNMSAQLCKTRWVNIRDMMRRRLRDRFRNPHQSTYIYRYEEYLAFVIPFFKETLTAEYTNEDFDNSQMEDPAHVYLEEVSYLNDSDTEMKPSLRQLTESLTQDTETNAASDDQVNTRYGELDSSDPIDVFLMTIGTTLRKFNPYYMNQAKSKIFQVVQDYELQQICDDKDCNAGSSKSNDR